MHVFDLSDHALEVLPRPLGVESREPWFDLMRNIPERWTALVETIKYVESCLDPCTLPGATLCMHAYVCIECASQPAFATQKALEAHQRVKHDRRLSINSFIGDTAICPTCHTNYVERWRLIRHLSDRRRPACHDAYMATSPPHVDMSLLMQLETSIREARKTARKKGHSHPIASGSAATRDGKAIGHVTL